MKQWEYRSLSAGLWPQEQLQQLGREGWELVAVISRGRCHDLFMKRERQCAMCASTELATDTLCISCDFMQAEKGSADHELHQGR